MVVLLKMAVRPVLAGDDGFLPKKIVYRFCTFSEKLSYKVCTLSCLSPVLIRLDGFCFNLYFLQIVYKLCTEKKDGVQVLYLPTIRQKLSTELYTGLST